MPWKHNLHSNRHGITPNNSKHTREYFIPFLASPPRQRPLCVTHSTFKIAGGLKASVRLAQMCRQGEDCRYLESNLSPCTPRRLPGVRITTSSPYTAGDGCPSGRDIIFPYSSWIPVMLEIPVRFEDVMLLQWCITFIKLNESPPETPT